MFELIIPPAFVMLIGAFLVAVSRPGLRPLIALAAPLVTLYAIWQIPDGVQMTARSGAWGRLAMSLYAWIPWTDSRLGFTG